MEDVVIRPLETEDEFDQTVEVQRSAWGFQDVDIMAPHLLRAMTKKVPESPGIVLGAFKGDELVGNTLGWPLVEPNHFYLYAIGVKKGCQCQNVGTKLMFELRKLCIERGFETIEWTYDPYLGLNANIFIRKCGAKATRFIPNYYGSTLRGAPHKHLPNDRFLTEWELLSKRVGEREKGKYPVEAIQDIIEAANLIKDDFVDSEKVYVEFPENKTHYVGIPGDMLVLKETNPTEARKFRERLHKVFTHYITERNYVVSELTTGFVDGMRKNFYTLARERK